MLFDRYSKYIDTPDRWSLMDNDVGDGVRRREYG